MAWSELRVKSTMHAAFVYLRPTKPTEKPNGNTPTRHIFARQKGASRRRHPLICASCPDLGRPKRATICIGGGVRDQETDELLRGCCVRACGSRMLIRKGWPISLDSLEIPSVRSTWSELNWRRFLVREQTRSYIQPMALTAGSDRTPTTVP